MRNRPAGCREACWHSSGGGCIMCGQRYLTTASMSVAQFIQSSPSLLKLEATWKPTLGSSQHVWPAAAASLHLWDTLTLSSWCFCGNWIWSHTNIEPQTAWTTVYIPIFFLLGLRKRKLHRYGNMMCSYAEVCPSNVHGWNMEAGPETNCT